jgi:hypothetical protein
MSQLPSVLWTALSFWQEVQGPLLLGHKATCIQATAPRRIMSSRILHPNRSLHLSLTRPEKYMGPGGLFTRRILRTNVSASENSLFIKAHDVFQSSASELTGLLVTVSPMTRLLFKQYLITLRDAKLYSLTQVSQLDLTNS